MEPDPTRTTFPARAVFDTRGETSDDFIVVPLTPEHIEVLMKARPFERLAFIAFDEFEPNRSCQEVECSRVDSRNNRGHVSLIGLERREISFQFLESHDGSSFMRYRWRCH